MMIKLHPVIVSAMLIVGFLTKPGTADLFPKCKDEKKGDFHIGNNVVLSCKNVKKGKASEKKKWCIEKNPTNENWGSRPPAREGCPKACGTCNMCTSLFSSFFGYQEKQIYSYPLGCAVNITVGQVCPGTTLTMAPISLYLDKETKKPASVTVMAGGNYVTNTTSLVHGVFNFAKSEKVKGGDLYFSTMTDIYKNNANATATGGTGMFENAGGSGSLKIDFPLEFGGSTENGFVEFKICPIFSKK